jgi:hypothetical protein
MIATMSQPFLRAYRWWCEDEVCDCTQYVIEEYTPRPPPSRAYDIRRVWQGQFVSDSASESRQERAARLRAFRNAARQHGIKLTHAATFEQWTGERPA